MLLACMVRCCGVYVFTSLSAILSLTYPLELILQNAGDVKAEIGAKRQQAVEKEHHEAIIRCRKKRKTIVTSYPKSEVPILLFFQA